MQDTIGLDLQDNDYMTTHIQNSSATTISNYCKY